MNTHIVRVLFALAYCAVAEKPALVAFWILTGRFWPLAWLEYLI